MLSRSPFGASADQLPRISEKLEPSGAMDADARARLLSEKLLQQQTAAVGSRVGSFERRASPDPAHMKKSQSYQALADLEKKGYFPAAPTVRGRHLRTNWTPLRTTDLGDVCGQASALGVQRGLKDSVVNDMCRAVVKHMVGDLYVAAADGSGGAKKVLNHLYEPVFQSVQVRTKFFILPTCPQSLVGRVRRPTWMGI